MRIRLFYPGPNENRAGRYHWCLLAPLKRLAVGRPIAPYQAGHHKFGLFGGLAVLSSDALSSVAYATEEVLRVLMIGGLAAMTFSPVIAIMIASLLAVVAFS